jgi:hypothetical protein
MLLIVNELIGRFGVFQGGPGTEGNKAIQLLIMVLTPAQEQFSEFNTAYRSLIE